MEVDQSESAALPAFSFRPAKRRKVFRQRREDADSGSEKETSGSASPGPLVAVKGSPTALLSEAQGDDGLSLSEVLRMRKAAQRRKGGVEFCSSTPQPQATSVAPPSPTVTQASETSTAISMINSRFAPPTGQVADVDKHMIAYVENEIAKQRNNYPTLSNSSTATTATTTLRNENGQTLSETGALQNGHTVHRQPASLGKLHEIDLGAEARRRNIERTQAAVEGRPSEHEEQKEEPVKMRLCRDGKFRPRRRRKRRNSEDIKRDEIVEDMFRESRLANIYDSPEAAAAAIGGANGVGNTANNEGDQEAAADDKIAEQFRREFLEAVAARHSQQKKQKKKKGEGEKSDDKIGGPKLGGSRSQRAAMHARQVAEKQAERNSGRK